MTATITVPAAPHRSSRHRVRDALTGRAAAPVVGLIAFVISAVGAGTPSYWGDEAASVLAAERPLPVLFGMLGHIDAVHGLYYLFLHFWIGLFGSAEAVVRFPSAIAVGLAAAGTVVLGRALFTRSTGIVAGLVFAFIPEVARMGAEARSYAFGMAVAVWLTVWFVSLVRRRSTSRRSWILYAVAAAGALYLFLYLGMLLIVHAAWVLLQRPGRAVVRAWALSLLGALVLAAPIVIAGISQRGQIGFLARRDYATPESVFIGQWFVPPESTPPAFAITAWALMLLAPVGILLMGGGRQHRRGLVLLAVWVVGPTALLLIGNALVTPMYNLRYVAFCTPAVAIVMALGVRTIAMAVPRRLAAPAAIAALAVVTAIGIPTVVDQHGPYAKDGSDLRQTAEVVQEHAAAGDAVVFDQTVKPSRRSRLAIDLYPKAFAGLDDIALVTSYRDRPELWDDAAPLKDLDAQLAVHPVVWAVEGSDAAPDVETLRSLGYRVEQTFPVHRSTVYRLVRG